MTEVEFLRRELERQLKAVDDLNKMVKDLSQITFESKMDKWLKASKAEEWVGLTTDQMMAIAEWQTSAHRPLIDVIKAVEQALKDKNI